MGFSRFIKFIVRTLRWFSDTGRSSTKTGLARSPKSRFTRSPRLRSRASKRRAGSIRASYVTYSSDTVATVYWVLYGTVRTVFGREFFREPSLPTVQ